MQAAALRVGTLLNHAELARDAKMPLTTVHQYMSLLETSLQATRLVPYARNRTKRLIKTPKLFWNDVGLALHLGRAEPSGAPLENYVLTDLLSWRDTETPRPEVSYWRTASGAEVDFVLERKKKLLAVEVKAGEAPAPPRRRTHQGVLRRVWVRSARRGDSSRRHRELLAPRSHHGPALVASHVTDRSNLDGRTWAVGALSCYYRAGARKNQIVTHWVSGFGRIVHGRGLLLRAAPHSLLVSGCAAWASTFGCSSTAGLLTALLTIRSEN